MNSNPASNRRPLAVLVIGSALSLPLNGCGEDPQIAAATEFGAKFSQLSEDYRKLAASRSLVSETGPANNTTDLASLLGSLNQLSGGTPEQSSAAALLRAQVATDLGTLESVRAARVEADCHRLLLLIGGIADAAVRIENLSNVEISLAGDRARLAETRAAADRETAEFRTLVAGMREPVARLTADRDRRMAEIAQIDGEIATLRRDAAAAGARAGFPLVEEAAELNGQAIRLRTRSTIELGQLNEATDQLALTETLLVDSEALSGSAQSALKELEDFSAILDRDAKAGRELVTALRTEAETLLARVDEMRGESLDERYRSAAAAFEQAGSAADTAADVAREPSNQFKLGSLRARASLLQSQIAGLDAEAAIREQLAAAGSLFGGAAKAKPALEAILARRATLLEEAKAAYGEVMSMIDSAGSQQPAMVRLRSSIEASMAMLEGREPPKSPSDPGPSSVSAAPRATSGGSAFMTAKALVDYLNSIDSKSVAGSMEALNFMHASTSNAKAFIEVTRSSADAMYPFLVAAQNAFGSDGMMNAIMGGMGGMGGGQMASNLTSLSLVSEDGESAQASTAAGATIDLVKVNGSWFIDADAMVAQMGDQAQGFAAAGGMMAMMSPAIKEAAMSVAARIEAGEFADAGTAMAAFNEALKSAMAKSMGGGLGGGQGGFGGGRP